MTIYDKLDSLIYEEIVKHRARTFSELLFALPGAEAKRLAQEIGREDFRVLDGQLQKLRKRGLIVFSMGAWVRA